MVTGYGSIVRLFVMATALVAGLQLPATAGLLSPEEARGKQIFLTGQSEAGRMIMAHVGRSSLSMPGKAMPCASCHGADGLGRPEGGVVPANIRWTTLSQAAGSSAGSLHERPAYTEATVVRAVAEGIDAGGTKLDVSMPRFEMDRQDMGDLLAYLRRLEHDLDPGLTGEGITLGTIMPQGGTSDSLGKVAAGVMTAYFDEINQQGGIYNRRITLKVIEASTKAQVIEQATTVIEHGEVFALVGPITSGVEQELDRLTEQHGVPLVGPFTQFPRHEDSLQRHTFYLFGGLSMQGTALLDFAANTFKLSPVKLSIVHSRDVQLGSFAEDVRKHAAARNWPAPHVIECPQGPAEMAAVVAQLTAAGTNTVLFLGTESELASFLREGVRRAWAPYVLLPGVSSGASLFTLPAEMNGLVFVAFPNGPDDYSEAGFAEFEGFRQRHQLSHHHLAAQVAAYAAVKVLTEGLKTAGVMLSRDRLINALEQLYEFKTGVTPVLTYGPNRRIGVQGAHVIGVDLTNHRFSAPSHWVAVQ